MRRCRGWVRILLPFQLWSTDSPRCLDDTLALAFTKGGDWLGLDDGVSKKIADSRYLEEYLPHVQAFLFGAVGATGCRYLRLKKDRVPPPLAQDGAEVWTKNLRIDENCPSQIAPGRPSARGLQLIGVAAQDPVWKASIPFDSPERRLPLRVTLDGDSGVELWTSRLGAGLMSISLECEPAEQAASENDGSSGRSCT